MAVVDSLGGKRLINDESPSPATPPATVKVFSSPPKMFSPPPTTPPPPIPPPMQNQTSSPTTSTLPRMQTFFADLEHRLQNSAWNGGVCEAHGLLCALACRGVRAAQLPGKAWLLRLSAARDLELVGAMFEEILRDLKDDGFSFALLLPQEQAGWARRVESLASWCGGFVQGFLHDAAQDDAQKISDTVREPFDDIMKISRIDIGIRRGHEHELVEIEEYLRVAAQLIFDELNPPARAAQ